MRQVVVKCVLIAVALALPFLVLVAFFGRPIAQLIGGPGFGAAGAVMLWLVCARTVMLAVPPATAALVALGRPGLSVAANTICSLGLLPLLPLLMHRFGLPGAGSHALLTAAVVAAILAALVWHASEGARVEQRT